MEILPRRGACSLLQGLVPVRGALCREAALIRSLSLEVRLADSSSLFLLCLKGAGRTWADGGASCCEHGIQAQWERERSLLPNICAQSKSLGEALATHIPACPLTIVSAR